MPGIQFIGFDRRTYDQEAARLRRLLGKEEYADKLNFVWFDSVSEDLVSKKQVPFIRIQGREAALVNMLDSLVEKLTNDFDIEVAFNMKWIPRST